MQGAVQEQRVLQRNWKRSMLEEIGSVLWKNSWEGMIHQCETLMKSVTRSEMEWNKKELGIKSCIGFSRLIEVINKKITSNRSFVRQDNYLYIIFPDLAPELQVVTGNG